MISYIFKNCYCFILYFILVAYLTVFGITIFYHGDLEKMVNLMDDNQKQIYSKIRKERLNHYLNGLGAGVILSLPTLYLIKNTASRVCASGIVLMMTASITYYLQPKSDYMIKHLNSQEQKEAWMNVSRNFIKKKISGVMIGLFLYMGLSMARK